MSASCSPVPKTDQGPPASASTPTHESDWQALKQLGIKRFRVSLPAYGCAVAIVALGMALGVVQPLIGLAMCTFSCMVLAGFYWALHTGVAARSKDPLLAFSHVLFGVCLVVLGYATFDGLRSTALLWLSVIIVFDMQRLPGRQVLFVVAMCAVLLPLATVARATWHAGPINWFYEIFTLLMLAVVIPALMAVATKARDVRKRHLEQKQQMAQTLEQLRQLAVRDGLTGLYNRSHMLNLLDDEVKRWQGQGHPFTVAVLDLDWFKRINDQFGHATGDAVLQTFAALGQKAFSDHLGVLARWGGEEFLLLHPQSAEQEARASLARLRAAVHAHDWTSCIKDRAADVASSSKLEVTFSAGICEHREDHALAQTLDHADQALYRAKAGGRDCIVVFKDDAQSNAMQAMHAVVASAKLNHRSDANLSEQSIQTHAAQLAAPQSVSVGHQRQRRSHAFFMHLADVVMGTNPRLRPNQGMALLAIVVYMSCVAGFLFYVEPAHLLTHQQTMLFVMHSILGAFVPFTVTRLGWTAHLSDPFCTLLQLIWAGTALIISHGLMPSLGASILQLICLCVVYGFLSLSPRECRFLGCTYIAMILCVAIIRIWLEPSSFNPRNELLELAMTCLILWVLTLQSQSFSHRRDRVRAEKRELTAATQRVNQRLRHDHLTGLSNRQHMQSILDLMCDRHLHCGADNGREFCVALIDLDHFKSINDTYGHQVGDEALQGFARVAQATFRDTDTICRWGGEEFLVLFSHTDPGPHGMIALNRLRENMASQRFCAGAPQLQITFSAGLATHTHNEPIASTLERADRALYAAKAAGRNCCLLADPPVLLKPVKRQNIPVGVA